MKTRGLFLSALLMGAVMAGCSNEEVLNEDNQKSLKKTENYVAVNIVAPGDFGSRAEEGSFKAGSSDENAVNDAWFVFFAENGNFVDAVEGSLKYAEVEGTGTVEKMAEAMIVLTDPPAWPTQVVALLNTGYTETDFQNMKDLAHLIAVTGDYRNLDNGFTMSNSVYEKDGKVMYSTPLLDSQICTSQEKALANPVSISVERVLAKVEAKKASNFTIQQPEGNIQLDGQDTTFKPEITGMALVYTAPQSFLIKEIDGASGSITWNGWNDAANERSYWALSMAQENGYETYSYDEVVEGQVTDNFSAYCHENTIAFFGDTEYATKLLVTAQFKAGDKYQDVIKYNGTYYTAEGLKNYFNDQYFASVTHGTSTVSNDWRDYMYFDASSDAGAEDWEVELYLTDNAPAANETTADLDAILANVNAKTMSQWTGGKCYYYVDVEHFGTGNAAIGVVRNHWYDITLNSIKGLGTPVFDPTIEINPDKPQEENYYVAAEVKILKWKMVSQEVDLQ